MNAILVRIGVDHSYGGWNAPADPITRRFVYVPIPEKEGRRFHPGCARRYSAVVPAIERFASDLGLDPVSDLGWPEHLARRAMHLDPDFDELTYGDVGDRRGSHIRDMQRGDIIVFYAGLRSTRPGDIRLIYALVGMMTVDEVVAAADVPRDRWHENAHTRRVKRGESDIVVRALRGRSGRFSKFVQIGGFRDGAYRIRKDLLRAWGGLTVKDGFIQRSARPPRFKRPEQFLAWLDQQEVELLETNNDVIGAAPVVLVLLRQPRMSNPEERRSDPFWEFGSFGCTGCHSANLMNLRRADELAGTRFGFAQGGPSGVRLVKLTPAVTVLKHPNCAEVRWTPATMPARYEAAPLLIDNQARTSSPRLKSLLENVAQPTWAGRFASKFRSRRRRLPDEVAQELVSVWTQFERSADSRLFARTYADALPCPPPCVDTKRKKTYTGFLSATHGKRSLGNRRCKKKRASKCARKRRGC